LGQVATTSTKQRIEPAGQGARRAPTGESPLSLAQRLRLATILRTATEAFLEGGYEAASISAIAGRLGGSKGTLYKYFQSKDELFAAVIRDQCDRNLASMFDAADMSDDDLASGLRALAHRFASTLLSDDVIRLSRALAASAGRFPELGRMAYESGVVPTVQRLADYLERQMAQSKIRPADPRRAAEQFLELTLAGLYRRRLWNVGPTVCQRDIADNVDAAVETFLAAYRTSRS
jgi:TetR/AcrR family transcriptional repressor of mexJK operon